MEEHESAGKGLDLPTHWPVVGMIHLCLFQRCFEQCRKGPQQAVGLLLMYM